MQTKQALIPIVAVALLLYSLCGFASVMRGLRETEAAAAESEERLQELENQRDELEALLSGGRDDEYLEALARERLGLVKSGEIVFYFR